MAPSATSAAPGDLPGAVRDILRRATAPGFERWQDMVRRTGGCAQPVHLIGETTTVQAATGELLHRYTSAGEPNERLLIACGNRRASRCPACAETYRADTFQLIRAGLTGGKGTSEGVRAHPRVFATFTAPSFGVVHTRRVHDTGQVLPCHPRRNGGTCPHGVPVSCTERHRADDPVLGQPLCPACYDYLGAVLWQAHAGELWRRFTIALRRRLAHAAGLTYAECDRQVRLSYAKVAEYQLRGLVHFHAVIRLDAADDDTSPPPAWATLELLEASIRSAARAVSVATPEVLDEPARLCVWGEQLDVRPITAFEAGTAITEEAVAAYIAKYATKGAEASGTVDRPIRSVDEISLLPLSAHAQAMIVTCWTLGGLAEFAHLNLRKWAHMLGFRGHFTTKSRRYSTTLTALRQARADYRAHQTREHLGLDEPDPETTLVLGHWRFAGTGYLPGEALLAATIHDTLRRTRQIAREERVHANDPPNTPATDRERTP